MYAFVNCLCSNYYAYNYTYLYKKWYIFTVEPKDYIELSMILTFPACDTRQCVNITIVDDLVNEPVEEFDVTLEKPRGLDPRISLNPMDARVVIRDDDGKLAI